MHIFSNFHYSLNLLVLLLFLKYVVVSLQMHNPPLAASKLPLLLEDIPTSLKALITY